MSNVLGAAQLARVDIKLDDGIVNLEVNIWFTVFFLLLSMKFYLTLFFNSLIFLQRPFYVCDSVKIYIIL